MYWNVGSSNVFCVYTSILIFSWAHLLLLQACKGSVIPSLNLTWHKYPLVGGSLWLAAKRPLHLSTRSKCWQGQKSQMAGGKLIKLSQPPPQLLQTCPRATWYFWTSAFMWRWSHILHPYCFPCTNISKYIKMKKCEPRICNHHVLWILDSQTRRCLPVAKKCKPRI